MRNSRILGAVAVHSLQLLLFNALYTQNSAQTA